MTRCRMLLPILVALLFASPAVAIAADRDVYLSILQRGWTYELRASVHGRMPPGPITINGRALSGAALCLVGEEPDPETRKVLDAFRTLMGEVFGAPVPMRHAGATARNCGSGRIVVLRLFSGQPPHAGLTDDIGWLNGVYGLGLAPGRRQIVGSPAMAQTFFGTRGQISHIVVQQSGAAGATPLEDAFHRSILIEELFQTFTFGMDVPKFDRDAPFVSKVEEIPFDLRHFSWNSDIFMSGLLRASPSGLCELDVLVLHAIARSPAAATNGADFLDFVAAEFDGLLIAARGTASDPRFRGLLDPDCGPDGPAAIGSP